MTTTHVLPDQPAAAVIYTANAAAAAIQRWLVDTGQTPSNDVAVALDLLETALRQAGHPAATTAPDRQPSTPGQALPEERRWSDADRELVADVLWRFPSKTVTRSAAAAVLDALTAAGWRKTAEPGCTCPTAGVMVRPECSAHPPVIHKPYSDDGVLYCGWSSGRRIYEGCGEVWPCSTVRAQEGDTDVD